jgi:outer membrane protein OmpA-like peptidoglycan-associated protein
VSGRRTVARLLALVFSLLAVAPALAQENPQAIVPTIRDVVPTVVDIVPKTPDLSLTVLDIVATVQDMITVTQTAKEVKIELPADVLFDFDKADIRPDAAVALAAAADLLRKGVSGAVKIDGHTDSKGAAAYNQKLSQDRANSVKAWFLKNGMLPANLAYTLTGYGATRPKVPNTNPDGSDSPANRQVNRRVEITFTTK